MNIKVYSNICRVEGSYNELVWLRDLLTIAVPGAKFTKIFQRRQWDGKKRFFNTISKVFPVGLLDYVLRNKDKQTVLIEDTRVFPILEKGFGDKIDYEIPKMNIELRDYQKQAIIDCLKYKNCIIEAATNAGKTVIFSGVVKKLHPFPTLILIHREEILKQIKDMVEKNTGLEVGIITSKDVLIKPVTVAMVTTLANRIGADQEITDFFDSVKCVIADECHHLKAKTIASLVYACKAVYRFGFSGTVADEDTYDGMLIRQHIGSVVFKISNDELISSGVSAKPKVFIYEIDSSSVLSGVFAQAKEELIVKYGDKVTNTMLMKKVYQLSVQKGIVENEERNSKVLEIISNNVGKSILIVVDLLEHGRIMEKMFVDKGIEAVFISGSSETRDSGLSDFKEGKLKVLISTNIVDEGLDISRIECLILLAGKKSRRQLLQRVGRSLRRKEGENVVKIYDFMDYGSLHLEKHSRQRIAIYKQEKFELEFV